MAELWALFPRSIFLFPGLKSSVDFPRARIKSLKKPYSFEMSVCLVHIILPHETMSTHPLHLCLLEINQGKLFERLLRREEEERLGERGFQKSFAFTPLRIIQLSLKMRRLAPLSLKGNNKKTEWNSGILSVQRRELYWKSLAMFHEPNGDKICTKFGRISCTHPLWTFLWKRFPFFPFWTQKCILQPT